MYILPQSNCKHPFVPIQNYEPICYKVLVIDIRKYLCFISKITCLAIFKNSPTHKMCAIVQLIILVSWTCSQLFSTNYYMTICVRNWNEIRVNHFKPFSSMHLQFLFCHINSYQFFLTTSHFIHINLGHEKPKQPIN